MPRFTSPDGNLTIETAIPREAAELRRDGFKEEKARTKAVKEAEASHDAGSGLPTGPAKVTNDTGSAEAVKASTKSAK